MDESTQMEERFGFHLQVARSYFIIPNVIILLKYKVFGTKQPIFSAMMRINFRIKDTIGLKSLMSVLFFWMFISPLWAQVAPPTDVNEAVARVQKYMENYPNEKIHLHFDKPYYAVGDTIWFKAYVTSNLNDYEWSKIAYVEVFNSTDSLMQTIKLPLVDHGGSGQLFLSPEWFSENNYRFRAYTKWMANFDNALFFNKIIPVGDAINNSLVSTIRFEDISTDKSTRTRVHMQLMDKSGLVFGKKKVNYVVQSGYETVDKGKAETDPMGHLTLQLSAKDRKLLQEGRLYISVDPDVKGRPTLNKDFSLKSALNDLDLQFFPEGGDLISGVTKKVAFKAVDHLGKGVPITGQIVNSKGDLITEFKSTHLGMGQFILIPEPNMTYSAQFTYGDGLKKTVSLPETKAAAINLIVQQVNDTEVQVGVMTNEAYLKQNEGQNYFIIAHTNGILSYGAQLSLKNEAALIRLPKEGIPTGILHITLLKANGEPVSERLVFVENEKPIDIEVSTDKSTYNQKDLVALHVAIPPIDSTYWANFSVAVTDESKVPYEEDDELTILSNFLLTSDLKGYIEKPNYYFNAANENRREALDVLLLTQGYRKFEYKQLMNEQLPQVVFFPEVGMELAGIVRYSSGHPAPKVGLLLSVEGSGYKKDTYTDENGRFVFQDLVIADSSKVTISARGNSNYRDLVIHMDGSQYPSIDRGLHAHSQVVDIASTLKPYLENSSKEFRTFTMLEEVVVESRNVVVGNHREHNALTGLGHPEHRISPSRLTGCNNLLSCLMHALPGITYDNDTRLFYLTREYNAGVRTPVQFFLDGIAFDVFEMATMSPSIVTGIDIFLKDDFGTVQKVYNSLGTVSIYTNRKSNSAGGQRISLSQLESLIPKANVVEMSPLGFIKQRSFYLPKYDTQERRNVTDIRTTVFWDPHLTLDSTGKASRQFYNADGVGSYRVIVEGIDSMGNFGRKVMRYIVK
jgi:hypothetical protein